PGTAAGASRLCDSDGGNLRLFGEVVDAMEDRVVEFEFDRLAFGKDTFDLLVEVGPFVFTPEVVDHEEPTVEEVTAERGDLGLVEVQPARFDHVDERVLEEFGIGEIQNSALGIDLERGEL